MRTDTICAPATPPGEGGVAILRASGADALSLLEGAFRPRPKNGFEDRRVYVGRVIDARGETIDECVCFYMKAPRSYTCEDVAEFQCHGGSACVKRLLARLIELGARAAEPGEFTKRAFENGRIDLAEAEAVMSLVSANAESARRAAVRQLKGGVSARISPLRARIISMLSGIEAAVDFPEEVEEDSLSEDLTREIEDVRDSLARISDEKAAHIARDGASVALVGRPNVGKSSLLNAIAGSELAIVDDEPGTTRDVLTERVTYGGRVMTLRDTAGQRETDSRVERAGVARAREAEAEADVAILTFSLAEPLTSEDKAMLSRADDKYIVVENKSDLPRAREPIPGSILSSAKTGEGVPEILRKISEKTGGAGMNEDALTIPRHLALSQSAQLSLKAAQEALRRGDGADLAAIPLWEAARALGEITGEDAGEDVLTAIFANFCVGK